VRSDLFVDIPILCCLLFYGCPTHIETTRDDQLQPLSHPCRSFASEKPYNTCLHKEIGLGWPLHRLNTHGMRPCLPLRHPPGVHGVQSEPVIHPLPRCRLTHSVCRRTLWNQYPKHSTVGSQNSGRSNGTCWSFRPPSSSCYSLHSMIYVLRLECVPH
jgi:hypothetical protein